METFSCSHPNGSSHYYAPKNYVLLLRLIAFVNSKITLKQSTTARGKTKALANVNSKQEAVRKLFETNVAEKLIDLTMVSYYNLCLYIDIKRVKSSLFLRYYAEMCNEWRGPSLRFSARAMQL